MLKGFRRVAAAAALCLGFSLSLAHTALAQAATPVPQLDFQRFTGGWYRLASSPLKPYKRCISDSVVLYAVDYKPGRFTIVTSCQTKSGAPESRNAKGKLDKNNDGRMKITYMWPFSTKEWVLALGPDYAWALLGTPRHKSFWILSRSATLPPDTMAEIKARAVAEGFDPSKLVPIAQHPGVRTPATTPTPTALPQPGAPPQP